MNSSAKKFFIAHAYELCLAFLVIAVFGQTLAYSFINYDDPSYVLDNAHINLTWQNVRWAFTSGYLANYHPLTWVSYMLDYGMFGYRPLGYHLENVIIHLLSTLILYRTLRRLSKNPGASFLAAALFAIHPLRAESVAWISERKDVLSVFFGLSAMWAYARYVERPGVLRYLAIAGLFVLSLLSKSMLVTLPAVLLLLDYWPLRRFDGTFRRAWLLFLEKTPLFALSLSAGLTALALKTEQNVEAASRFASIPIIYGEYVLRVLWPTHLMIHYRIIEHQIASTPFIASVLTLAAITIALFILRRSRPYLLMGWLWFMGTLIPVTGFVQVGDIRASDRYTYFPSIGLFMGVSWMLASLVESKRISARAGTAVTACLVVVVSVMAWFQTGHWRNTETVFAHAVAVSPDDALSNYNLGCELMAQGRNEQAEPLLTAAVKQDPYAVDYWTNLGVAWGNLGKHEDALQCYLNALAVKPAHIEALINLGFSLGMLKRFDEAEFYLKNAMSVDPANADAMYNLASVYYRQDRFDGALPLLAKALNARPDFIEAAYLLAQTLQKLQRPLDAANVARQILQFQPNHQGASKLLNSLGLQ